MATEADIINRVLVRLNKLPAGQTAPAGQFTTVQKNLTAQLLHFAKKGVIDYSTAEAMPTEDEDPIVTLVAWRSRFDLGVSQSRINNLAGEVVPAMQAIYAHHETPSDGEPVEAEYF